MRDDEGNDLTYCPIHGGPKQLSVKREQSLNNYRLQRWNHRLQEKVDSSGIKSLRDEIGILRMMMEERLNQCKDGHDLMLQSHAISDLAMKIERVVTSCHKLEGSMGQLLDKQAILQFAQVVINIVSINITDETLLTTIADQIVESIDDSGT